MDMNSSGHLNWASGLSNSEISTRKRHLGIFDHWLNVKPGAGASTAGDLRIAGAPPLGGRPS